MEIQVAHSTTRCESNSKESDIKIFDIEKSQFPSPPNSAADAGESIVSEDEHTPLLQNSSNLKQCVASPNSSTLFFTETTELKTQSSFPSYSGLPSIVKAGDRETTSISDACKSNNKITDSPFSIIKALLSSADMRISMLSNFSAAYNTISVSLALNIMDGIYDGTDEDTSMCTSTLLAGMIAGQLCGGALGDLMGRRLAMAVVMSIQVIAALASALSFEPPTILHLSIYHVLAVWRFLLGVGCGGVYPLAATLSAESSKTKDKGRLVAATFSMQGVGYLSVPLVAYMIVSILGESSDLSWRLLLGLGAIPGFILTILRVCGKKKDTLLHKNPKSPRKIVSFAEDLDITLQTSKCNIHAPKHIASSLTNLTTLETTATAGTTGTTNSYQSLSTMIYNEEDLVRKLVGTAGCWFLFDILFYGNTLFEPIILSAAFGEDENVRKTARDTAILTAIALPGYFMSVLLIERQGPQYIQMQGFVIMAVLYTAIGLLFDSLSEHRFLLLMMYGSSFFFSNYGPNSTTFMLPSMTFSRECRSTLNGFCAASGKTGALVGSILFVPISSRLGDDVVMVCCSSLSVIGFILTWCCVPRDIGRKRYRKESATKPANAIHVGSLLSTETV